MNRVLIVFMALLTAAMPLVVDSALKGAALLGLAAVAALLLWRASAATRHLVWLVAVLALLLVPVLSILLPGWRVLPEWAVAPQVKVPPVSSLEKDRNYEPYTAFSGDRPAPEESLPPLPPTLPASPAPLQLPAPPSVEPASVTPPEPPAAAEENWRRALPAIWVAGCGLLLVRLLGAHCLLRRSSRRCVPVTDGPLATALYAAAAQLGVRRQIRLRLDEQRTIPVVWGVWRPRLILPAEALTWDGAQLQSVLLHELGHIRRRDTLVQWLTQLACALHWFNPLVWLAAWRLHVERERACDDLVLAAGVRPSEYASHLLDVASRLSPARWTSACGLAMARQSSLEGRLLAVLSDKLNRRRLTRALTAAAILLSAVIAVPIAMLRASEEKPADSKSSSSSEASQEIDWHKVFCAEFAVGCAQLDQLESFDAAQLHQIAKTPAAEFQRLEQTPPGKDWPHHIGNLESLILKAAAARNPDFRYLLENETLVKDEKYGWGSALKAYDYMVNGNGKALDALLPAEPEYAWRSGDALAHIDEWDKSLAWMQKHAGGDGEGYELWHEFWLTRAYLFTDHYKAYFKEHPDCGGRSPEWFLEMSGKPYRGSEIGKETEAKLKWGEPVNGLRMALAFPPAFTWSLLGKEPYFQLVVQNVSEKAVHFTTGDDAPNPRSMIWREGERIVQSLSDKEAQKTDWNLAPGECGVLRLFTKEEPTKDGKTISALLEGDLAGGPRYHVICTMEVAKAPAGAWTGKLVTGETRGSADTTPRVTREMLEGVWSGEQDGVQFGIHFRWDSEHEQAHWRVQSPGNNLEIDTSVLLDATRGTARLVFRKGLEFEHEYGSLNAGDGGTMLLDMNPNPHIGDQPLITRRKGLILRKQPGVARHTPEHKHARALYEIWQRHARLSGDIPGALIGELAAAVKVFISYNPTWESVPKLKEILPRLDASHDWKPTDAIALLDEVAAVQDSPLQTAAEKTTAATIRQGEALPEKFAGVTWGETQPNGLRAAWVLEPGAAEHRMGTALKARLLVQNTGTLPVMARVPTWHQGSVSARDAAGAEVEVPGISWTTIPMLVPVRLGPGEFIEINAPGVGLGKDAGRGPWAGPRVGSNVLAKDGTELTLTHGPLALDGSGVGMREDAPHLIGPGWWQAHIKARFSRELPLPATGAQRTHLLDRAVRELFATSPTPDEIAAFATDQTEGAFDALVQRLATRADVVEFSASLPTAPVKFRVLPADPAADKTPRVVLGPGEYPLSGGSATHGAVTLKIVGRPVGDRRTNDAQLLFEPTEFTGKLPPDPHKLEISDGWGTWAIVCRPSDPFFYLLHKGGARKIDYSDPAKVTDTPATDLPTGFRDEVKRQFDIAEVPAESQAEVLGKPAPPAATPAPKTSAVSPKNGYAGSQFTLWQKYARENGDIPGGLIALLDAPMADSPDPRVQELRKRLDGTRDWPAREAADLLDALAATQNWIGDDGRLRNYEHYDITHTGKPLPPELASLPWADEHEGVRYPAGLRVAFSMEPAAGSYAQGTQMPVTIHYHNSGTAPLAFPTGGRSTDIATARDGNGQKVYTDWTGAMKDGAWGPHHSVRLDPGHWISLPGAQITIAAGHHADGPNAHGIVLLAKSGTSVALKWGATTVTLAEGYGKPGFDWNTRVEMTVKRHAPMPKGRADRENLIRRVTLALTGVEAAEADIARFAADDTPDALNTLTARLKALPPLTRCVGWFFSGEQKFTVTPGPVDYRGTIMSASGAGAYELADGLILDHFGGHFNFEFLRPPPHPMPGTTEMRGENLTNIPHGIVWRHGSEIIWVAETKRVRKFDFTVPGKLTQTELPPGLASVPEELRAELVKAFPAISAVESPKAPGPADTPKTAVQPVTDGTSSAVVLRADGQEPVVILTGLALTVSPDSTSRSGAVTVDVGTSDKSKIRYTWPEDAQGFLDLELGGRGVFRFDLSRGRVFFVKLERSADVFQVPAGVKVPVITSPEALPEAAAAVTAWYAASDDRARWECSRVVLSASEYKNGQPLDAAADKIVWAAANDAGLRLGLGGLEPGASYPVGQQLPVKQYIRNDGTKTIAFSPTQIFNEGVGGELVRTADGKKFPHKKGYPWQGFFDRVRLAPGHYIALGSGPLRTIMAEKDGSSPGGMDMMAHGFTVLPGEYTLQLTHDIGQLQACPANFLRGDPRGAPGLGEWTGVLTSRPVPLRLVDQQVKTAKAGEREAFGDRYMIAFDKGVLKLRHYNGYPNMSRTGGPWEDGSRDWKVPAADGEYVAAWAVGGKGLWVKDTSGITHLIVKDVLTENGKWTPDQFSGGLGDMPAGVRAALQLPPLTAVQPFDFRKLPNAPGAAKIGGEFFEMALSQGTVLKVPHKGSGFFIESGGSAYGPAEGNPAVELGLTDLLRTRLAEKPNTAGLEMLRHMIANGRGTIRNCAFRMLADMKAPQAPFDYDPVFRAMIQASIQDENGPKELTPEARLGYTWFLNHFHSTRLEWERTRPLLAAGRYQPGDAPVADPAIVWTAGPNGLSLGISGLPADTNLAIGKSVPVTVYLRNDTQAPVKLSVPADHNPVVQISLTDAAGAKYRAIYRYSPPLTGYRHHELAPGTGTKVAAFDLETYATPEEASGAEPKEGKAHNPRLAVPAGSYDLHLEYRNYQENPVPKGAASEWTGKLTARPVPMKIAATAAEPAPEAPKSAAQSRPQHETAQSLFRKWQAGARTDGKIPGGLIGQLARTTDDAVKQITDADVSAKLAAVRPRLDASRDWTQAEAVALLDDITAIATAPVSWADNAMQFSSERVFRRGEPLPVALESAAWGAPAANGLRAAWLLEPPAEQYALGTVLKARVLFHNTGKAPVVFETETWHQDDKHSARDAKGAEIPVKATWFTGITPTSKFRLAPGEYCEVSGHGIAIGAGEYKDEHSTGAVGAIIEAKEGETVTLSHSVDAGTGGWTRPDDLWLTTIARRVGNEAPMPASTADLEQLIRRVTLDILGTEPTAEEIAAFTADNTPDALAKLTARLQAQPQIEPFTGKLPTGETKFRVLPADPNAAKAPRTATAPGRYVLGDGVHLQVRQVTEDGKRTNSAEILFFSPDPKKESPHKPHNIALPDEFTFAWQRGSGQLWLLKEEFLWRFTFTSEGGLGEEGGYDLWPPTVLFRPMKRALLAASGRATSVDVPPLGDETLEQVEDVQQLKQVHVKLRPETEAALSWGPSVNGLRTALVPMPGATELKLGAVLDYNIVFQNVSSAPLSVRATFPAAFASIEVLDSQGKAVQVGPSMVSVLSGAADVTLEPKEIVVATLLSTGIGKSNANASSPRARTIGQWFTPPAGDATLSCRLDIRDPGQGSWTGTLTTGLIKLQTAGATTPGGEVPKTSDAGPRRKVDWSKPPDMSEFEGKYDPELLARLAAKPEKLNEDSGSGTNVWPLAEQILRAAVEGDAQFRHLLADDRLKAADIDNRILTMSLAAYDYSVFGNKAALKVILERLERGQNEDYLTAFYLGFVDEWDQSIPAVERVFAHRDGGKGDEYHGIWAHRQWFFPESYAAFQKKQLEANMLDAASLQGVWKGSKENVDVTLHFGKSQDWEVRFLKTDRKAALSTKPSYTATRLHLMGANEKGTPVHCGTLRRGTDGELLLHVLQHGATRKDLGYRRVTDLVLTREADAPKGADAGLRRKVDWQAFAGYASADAPFANPFVPEDALKLAAVPNKSENDIQRLRKMLIQAAVEKATELRPLLKDEALKKADDPLNSLKLALAAYEFSVNGSEASLEYIIKEMAVRTADNDSAETAGWTLVWLDEWEQTPEAFSKLFVGNLEEHASFWELREQLYPESYAKAFAKELEAAKLDAASLRGVWKGSKDGMTAELRLGEKNRWDLAQGETAFSKAELRTHTPPGADYVELHIQKVTKNEMPFTYGSVRRINANTLKLHLFPPGGAGAPQAVEMEIKRQSEDTPAKKTARAVELTPESLLGTWSGTVNGEKLMLSFHRPPAEKDVQCDIYFGEATIGALAGFTIAEDGGSAEVVQHSAGGGMKFGTLIPGEAGKLKLELYGRQKGQQETILTREAEAASTGPRQAEARELLAMWKAAAYGSETIPGVFLWPLVSEAQACAEANPNLDSSARLLELFDSRITERDWKQTELIPLLNAATDCSDELLKACLASERLAQRWLGTWEGKVGGRVCSLWVVRRSPAVTGITMMMLYPEEGVFDDLVYNANSNRVTLDLRVYNDHGKTSPFGRLESVSDTELRFIPAGTNAEDGGVILNRKVEVPPTEPGEQIARELFTLWKSTANADGSIPGAFIGQLATEVRVFGKAHAGRVHADNIVKLLPRFVTSRDWTPAEVISLLDDVAYYSTEPIEALRKKTAAETQPAGKTAEQIVESVRPKLSGLPLLKGTLRTDGRDTPFKLEMTGTELRLRFENPARELALTLGLESAELKDSAGPVRPGDRILDSEVTLGDLSMRCLYWPEKKLIGQETIKTLKCDVVDCINPDAQNDCMMVRLFVSRPGWLLPSGTIIRMNCYNRAGKLARVISITSAMKIPDVRGEELTVVKSMEVVRYEPGSMKVAGSTVITLEKPQ